MASSDNRTPQPLQNRVAIVKPDGTPTDYFIKWAQDRQIAIGDSITMATLLQFLQDHQLQAGTAIHITPDGDLANDPTIAYNGALSNQSDVDVTTTPPTNGQALVYDNAASKWKPGTVASSGGGGGAVQRLQQVVLTAATASVTISNIDQSYEDLLIEVVAQTSDAANQNLFVRFNGDTGANYDSEQLNAFSSTVTGVQLVGQTSGYIGNLPPSSATSRPGSHSIIINGYARTVFFKQALGDFGSSLGTGATTQGRGLHCVTWRNTAAINSITFLTSAGNLVAGTVINVYGRGASPKSWGGNVIAEYVCIGGETSVPFSNIPQTFRDLELVVEGRCTNAANDTEIRIQMNGDTGANYDFEKAFFLASTTSYVSQQTQTSASLGQLPAASTTAGFNGGFTTRLFSYAKAVFYKGFSTVAAQREASAVNTRSMIASGQWRNTTAITSLTVFPNGGAGFAAGTVLTLYGVGGPGGSPTANIPTLGAPVGNLIANAAPSVNNYLMRYLVADKDFTINKIAFFMSAAVPTTKLQAFVYTTDSAAAAGGTLRGSSAQVTGVVAGYNEIQLTAPVTVVKGQAIWIGVSVTTAALANLWGTIGLAAFAANGSSTVPAATCPALTGLTTYGSVYGFWAVA